MFECFSYIFILWFIFTYIFYRFILFKTITHLTVCNINRYTQRTFQILFLNFI